MEGDTLCIIEAMKIMNNIEAEQSGRIIKILVENGKSVEYNQLLFEIKPLGFLCLKRFLLQTEVKLPQELFEHAEK